MVKIQFLNNWRDNLLGLHRFLGNRRGIPGLTLKVGNSFSQGATPVHVPLSVGKELLLMGIYDRGSIVLMNSLEWKDGIPTRITGYFLNPLDGDPDVGVIKDSLQILKRGDKHVPLPSATGQQEVPQE